MWWEFIFYSLLLLSSFLIISLYWIWSDMNFLSNEENRNWFSSIQLTNILGIIVSNSTDKSLFIWVKIIFFYHLVQQIYCFNKCQIKKIIISKYFSNNLHEIIDLTFILNSNHYQNIKRYLQKSMIYSLIKILTHYLHFY
jgi:hypothetical protein